MKDFLGVPLGSLDPDPNNFVAAFEGSAIKQTITAKAGDVLSFNWNFLSNESLNGDYAFITLNGLSELGNSAATLLTSNMPFLKETGYQTFSYTVTTSGTYTLRIGVVDVNDFNETSALLIDDVKLTSTEPPKSVPEPTSSLGILLFISYQLSVVNSFLNQLIIGN
ncbi:MAG: hypothetical protein QNJ54_17965 [Prochloraceae cyanobacterium]|nr:hypothetical protein [Prochloraceae cyanobacterium]